MTTFGESHGAAIGAVVDGCPAGIKIEKDEIQRALDRRKPGSTAGGEKNPAVTARAESDEVEILSGVFDGVSEGTPIALLIRNAAQKSGDYSNIKDTFRPGHADFAYFSKYGTRDWRGGGRASGRETAARVAAGAIAKALLDTLGVSVTAFTIEAAGVKCMARDIGAVEKNAMRACDSRAAEKMLERIRSLRAKGDSAGGIIECVATGVGAGLGEPVFDKLDAEIAKAVMSIGAVKGVEFGAGFECARMTGSQNNDAMRLDGGRPVFMSNNAGGTLGGISNGNDIVFRAAIKPVPSVFVAQKTLRSERGALEECDIVIEGRHDVCLCPRVVPVIEAMARLAIADMILRNRSARK